MKNKICYIIFLLSLSLSIKVLADPVKIGLLLPLKGASGNYYFSEEDPTKLKNAGNRFIFPIDIRKVSQDGLSVPVR